MSDQYAELRAALARVEKFPHPDVIASWAWQAPSVRALLAERDALIHDNAEYVEAACALATENERLRSALTDIDSRLRASIAAGASAADAYDTFYRGVVTDALTQQEQV